MVVITFGILEKMDPPTCAEQSYTQRGSRRNSWEIWVFRMVQVWVSRGLSADDDTTRAIETMKDQDYYHEWGLELKGVRVTIRA